MQSHPLSIISGALAINLLTTPLLLSAPRRHAPPPSEKPTKPDKANTNQPSIETLITEANRLRSAGKYANAVLIRKKILSIQEKTLEPGHPAIATNLYNLAHLLISQGQLAEAEPLLRRSLEIDEKNLGPHHLTIAASLSKLAALLEAQGKYDAAEPLLQRSLAIREKELGPDHPDVTVNLNELAGVMRHQERFTSAEPLLRRSIAILEKKLGPDHPNVANNLTNLALILGEQGKHDAAESLLHRSLTLLEKAYGPDHLDVATNLNSLALILSKQRKLTAAEPLYRRALAIREKKLGPNHSETATSLTNLALLLRDQEKFDAAEPLLRRSLSINEKILNPDHPDVANSLYDLAGVLGDQGEYATAEILLQHSLAIREKILGQHHPDVADALNNLAGILRSQGKYAKAEPLLYRSLAIRQKTLGRNHSDIATSLHNLAAVLSDQGKYADAEHFLRDSLNILSQALQVDHPDTAHILNSLAMVLSQEGKQAEAEALYRRALAIQEDKLGPDHLDVATTLNNLALLLSSQEQLDSAEPLQRRAQRIYEKILGPEHPIVATSLNNLGVLLDKQGRHGAAEPLLHRALAIREKVLGPNHPSVGTSLNNLGTLLLERRMHDKASPLFRRSTTIFRQTLGPNHPDLATSLDHLSILLKEQGDHTAAVSTLSHALTIRSNWLIRELPLLSDQSRTKQLQQLGVAWELTFGWIGEYAPAAKLALETRLNRQGLMPEIEQRQAMLLNTSGVDRSRVERLQALRQQLASISLPTERRAGLRDQQDRLEAELYRQIPDLQIQLVTPAAVAKALPVDGVLVEFQRYRPFDTLKATGKRFGEARYIALVLKPNGSISSVQLGPAAAIDATVHKGLSSSAQDQQDAEANWAQLSDQVFKPLLPELNGSRQWFLSPDSELNRVPFAALPAPQQPSTPLGQAVQLRLLTTGRDLVRLQQRAPSGSHALVIANPSYDRSGSKTERAVESDAVLNVSQRRSADIGSTRWSALPGTQLEGQKVASLLGSHLLSGPAATTTALQQQQGPRVLHIATHGFFVADQDSKPSNPLRIVQEEAPQLKALRGEDPQLRSGLVFAGANQPALDPKDDGYLTAAEALNLKLKGTELVVLSACSTGQGEVRTGEGVYGLQRSLTVAGARSTLLSLWKVDDAATAEFMTRFYKRLKTGEGRGDALAAVQKEFRDGIPGKAEWKAPYYWAAWQLVGDWRPIPGL